MLGSYVVAERLLHAGELLQLPFSTFFPVCAIATRLLLLPVAVKQAQASHTLSWSIAANPQKPVQAMKYAHSLASRDRTSHAPVGTSKHTASPFWLVSAPAVQIPAFVCMTASIRRIVSEISPASLLPWHTSPALMLTPEATLSSSSSSLVAPLGVAGAFLPAMLMISHFSSLSLSFRRLQSQPGKARLLALQRVLLEWLSVPALLVSLFMPQGVVLYWVSHSALGVAQASVLQHSRIRNAIMPTLPDISRLNDAAKKQNAGEFAAAEQSLRAAVDAAPNESYTAAALASLLSQRRKFADAAQYYLAGASTAPDAARQQHLLLCAGQNFKRANEASSALDVFHQAQQLDAGAYDHDQINREFIEPTKRDLRRAQEDTTKQKRKRGKKRTALPESDAHDPSSVPPVQY